MVEPKTMRLTRALLPFLSLLLAGCVAACGGTTSERLIGQAANAQPVDVGPSSALAFVVQAEPGRPVDIIAHLENAPRGVRVGLGCVGGPAPASAHVDETTWLSSCPGGPDTLVFVNVEGVDFTIAPGALALEARQ